MSTSYPLVSVLIPAYNHENYIQETIKSIINQTYKNVELIVIDDGSKDNTWQRIQELKGVCEKRFVKIHFETKENEGTCKTLNKLLHCANGEFIYIIASDDLAKSQAIEKEVDFLNQHIEYSLCVGNNEIIDFEGRICYWDKFRNIVYKKDCAKFLTFGAYLQNKTKFNLSSKKFGGYKSLYKRNYVPNGYLIRKSLFEKIGNFTPDAPLEDWWLMLQISKYSKMKYLDEVLFGYRWHNLNTIKQDNKINHYCQRTIAYEDKILQTLDITKLPVFNQKIISKIKKEGVCVSVIGIPFILTFNNYKKGNNKIRKIKLLNITIFEWMKQGFKK